MMRRISPRTLVNVLFVILHGLVEPLQTQHQAPIPSCVYYNIEEEHLMPLNDTNETTKKPEVHGDCRVTPADDSCVYFSQFMSHKLKMSDKFIYTTGNNTQHYYVNITMQSDWDHVTNRYLLQEKMGTCWNVQVMEGKFPYELVVFNLPLSKESSHLTAAPVTMVQDMRSCNSSETTCKVLERSIILDFFPIPKGQQVKLKIKRNTLDVENTQCRIDLMSGNCSITCDGSINACPVNILSNQVINLTSWAGKEIGFKNVTPGYYCARIDFLSNCCAFHTVTVKLEGSSVDDHVIIYNTTSLLPVTVIVVIILSLIFLFALKKKLCRLDFFGALNSLMDEPEEEREHTLIEDTRRLIEDMKINNKIFLAYPNESQEFLDLISSFRRLLQIFAEVRDPLDEIEIVNENPPLWLTGVLHQPNICIIVVETQSAVEIENAWLNKRQLPFHQEHHLNNIFIQTLSFLMDNAQSNLNSSKFLVRFSRNIASMRLFLGISRYQMPYDFERLIYHISRQATNCGSIDEQDFLRFNFTSPERDEFINRLKTIRTN